MKTITIANVKGGVAKTSTTLCLSSILSEELGRSILSIDLDSQNSLSSHHLLEYSGYTVRDLILGTCTIDQTINLLSDRHSFIPSDISLMSINSQLFLPAKEAVLTGRLEGLNYDYCLIDTPPNQMLETSMAIHAADVILIPTQLNRWSMTSIELTINWVHEIERAYKLAEKLISILPTFYQKTSVAEAVLHNLIAKYGSMVVDTRIRRRIDMDKIALLQLDISEFKNTDVYADYRAFLQEVML